MSMTALAGPIRGRRLHPISGEDELLADAHKTLAGYFPNLLTVIVPRPSRSRARRFARMVEASGLHAGLRSAARSCRRPPTDIYVADTMGELGLLLPSVADRVHGAARWSSMAGKIRSRAVKLGASVVHGAPTSFNFGNVYEALDRAGGARKGR